MYLIHFSDQSIDVTFAVTSVAIVGELTTNVAEAAARARQLKWPQEFVDLFEVRADGVDLVDHVFNAHNTLLFQFVFDDHVVGDWLRGRGVRQVTSDNNNNNKRTLR